MKQDINTILIHWLGGYTVDESVESDKNSWVIGKMCALLAVQDMIVSLYGKPADEQLKALNDFVEDELKHPERRI